MAHPRYIREKALQMRVERDLSIDEIAERLALPRTTVYYWVKDLPLKQRRNNWKLGQVRAVAATKAKYKKLRDEAYARGIAEYDKLMREPTFRDFVILYIAEGTKKSRNQVAICNSDEQVMALATRWLRRFERNPMQFSVQYHADQDLSQIRRFWGELLCVAPEAITMQRKSNSGKLNGRGWRSAHGVLTVRTSDTLLRARLQAWMDRICAEWS